MEKLKFKISSHLKDLIGRDLVTDEFIAVFELVKNSCDAHATKVKVIFENIYFDGGENAKITIMDDGKGMNLRDLKNKWLFLAYSAKRDNTEDADYKLKSNNIKRYAGSKGIGRFSCDRLGASLRILTRNKQIDAKLETISVDWTNFESDAKKEFSDISVQHETLSEFPDKDFIHGTILEISNLRDSWDTPRLKKLKKALEKLINPMQMPSDNNFSIELIVPEETERDKGCSPFEKINGVVKNKILDTVGLKATKIQVTVNSEGVIETTLVDRGTEIYRVIENNRKNPNPDKKTFHLLKGIRITVYALNTKAKELFAKKMGMKSISYGSIFVYKDGFRIFPYGEEKDDSLGIDRRKQQGHYRYLGTREIIGSIEIDGEYSGLYESTSRDRGLVRNDEYNQLLDFFIAVVLRRLEIYTIDIIKWGDDRFDRITKELVHKALSPDDVKGEILKLISDMTKSENVIDVAYNSDFLNIINEKQDGAARSAFKSINAIAERTNNEELRKSVARAERHLKEINKAKRHVEKQSEEILAKNTTLSSQNLFLKSDLTYDATIHQSLQHHITHVTNAILEYSEICIDSLQKANYPEVKEYLNWIYMESQKLALVSNYISKANFKTQVEVINADLVQFVKEYIFNIATTHSKKIDFKINSIENIVLKTKFTPIEIIIVLDNLINNSIKANSTEIEITWKAEQSGNAIMKFRDNGCGISQDDLPQIFNYRFTTTRGGGLGLYHVKEILDGIDSKIHATSILNKGTIFEIAFKL